METPKGSWRPIALDLQALRRSWSEGIPGGALSVIDTHTAGNPTRIIVDGIEVPENVRDVPDVRAWLRDEADWVRRRLIHEPRGGGLTCAVLPLPATDASHDIGAVILEPGSYPPMCGHCMIGLSIAVDEFDLLPHRPRIDGLRQFTIRTPAGLVSAVVDRRAGNEAQVRLTNVTSSLVMSWQQELLGRTVTVDLPYGGDYYLSVDAARLNLTLTVENALEIRRTAIELAASTKSRDLRSPLSGEPLDVYQVMFYAELPGERPVYRVVVVAPPGEIDRSPCGTGSSALLALLLAKDTMAVTDALTTRSIINTEFQVRALDSIARGDVIEVTPELTGSAHVNGFATIVADPADPLRDGFPPI